MEVVLAFACGTMAMLFAVALGVFVARRGQQRRDVHLARLARDRRLRSERGRTDRRAVWYWGRHDGRPLGLSLWAHKGYQGADALVLQPVFLSNVVLGVRASLPADTVLWRREPATGARAPAQGRALEQCFDVATGLDALPPEVLQAAIDFVQRWPALRLRPLDAAWRGRLPAGWPSQDSGVLVMTDLRTEEVAPEVLDAVLADLERIAAALESSAPPAGGAR